MLSTQKIFAILTLAFAVKSWVCFGLPVTFVFGDSLTEVGNNNYLQYSLARSDFPWYGVDYNGGKATGRFTNGRTIGDIICTQLRYNIFFDLYHIALMLISIAFHVVAAKLGIPPPPPYLSLAPDDDALLLGARKIVFHGIGPLGCIPSQRVKSAMGTCLKKVNQWVLEFNARVQKLLITLNGRHPKSKFAFADTYPDVLDLIENADTYGFKVSNTSCCNVDTELGGLCLPNSKLCKNRHEFVFWDAFHPSDAANQVLADKLFSSLFAPAPAPH